MGGELGGDFSDLVVFRGVVVVGFEVVEDLGFEGRRSGKDEESALGGMVEEEKRGKEFGKRKT